ncbi:MAG: putative rane protein [Chloroflexi bacterium]|nr:putative rane protein [Chloroflexota bacterium]
MDQVFQTIVIVSGAALLGWLAGMLVNYLADILPTNRKLTLAVCQSCNAPQPAIRYLLWPGRCIHCDSQRSKRTWVVVFVFMLISIWLALNPPEGLGYFAWLIILIYFGLVWIIDQEHRLILHITSAVGVVIGMIAGSLRLGLSATLFGGLVGFTLMLVLFLFGILFARVAGRVRGSTIQEAAMGFGDVLLGLIIGLLVGWPSILQSLFLTIVLAGGFSLIFIILMLIQRRYNLGTAFPYGPFMILGALIVLFL